MPVNATMQKGFFDGKCSKCKRAQTPELFNTAGIIYRTRNTCRLTAWRRVHPNREWFEYSPAHRAQHIDSDGNQDDIRDSNARLLLLLLSSSSAAAASTADYFGPEPEPEPEPELEK